MRSNFSDTGGKRKAPDGSMAEDAAAKRAKTDSGDGVAKPKKGNEHISQGCAERCTPDDYFKQ